jgi:hypothetical protein
LGDDEGDKTWLLGLMSDSVIHHCIPIRTDSAIAAESMVVSAEKDTIKLSTDMAKTFMN